jgi:hypothetical protein
LGERRNRRENASPTQTRRKDSTPSFQAEQSAVRLVFYFGEKQTDGAVVLQKEVQLGENAVVSIKLLHIQNESARCYAQALWTFRRSTCHLIEAVLILDLKASEMRFRGQRTAFSRFIAGLWAEKRRFAELKDRSRSPKMRIKTAS